LEGRDRVLRRRWKKKKKNKEK